MQIDLRKQLGQLVGFFVLFALALFLPAGTLSWLAGWFFLGLFFSFYIAITWWLFKHNPALMRERMSLATSDQQGWDKVLFPLLLVYTFAWLIFMSLDAARFHWSQAAAWVQILGSIILVCSFYLLFLTFRENSYLSPVVRVQGERGHRVVSTGPYHYVRHPMYAAIFVFMVGTSLSLGSYYGIPLGLVFIGMLARRAVLEERILRKELNGYADYMERVRYRLVPYLW